MSRNWKNERRRRQSILKPTLSNLALIKHFFLLLPHILVGHSIEVPLEHANQNNQQYVVYET
jgi:hypothetical protein